METELGNNLQPSDIVCFWGVRVNLRQVSLVCTTIVLRISISILYWINLENTSEEKCEKSLASGFLCKCYCSAKIRKQERVALQERKETIFLQVIAGFIMYHVSCKKNQIAFFCKYQISINIWQVTCSMYQSFRL